MEPKNITNKVQLISHIRIDRLYSVDIIYNSLDMKSIVYSFSLQDIRNPISGLFPLPLLNHDQPLKRNTSLLINKDQGSALHPFFSPKIENHNNPNN
jgi:hypothetical protein